MSFNFLNVTVVKKIQTGSNTPRELNRRLCQQVILLIN